MSDERIAGKDPRDEQVEPVKDEFLESEEHEETSDELRREMDANIKDADLSTEEGREDLVESGEIQTWEEGFAEGAEGGGHSPKCENCGKTLGDSKEGTFQKEINNTVHWFCSVECSDKYEAK